jgi:hypothetical protein
MVQRLVSETLNGLAVALAAAAITVGVLAWISTWQDVGEIGRPAYLFCPLAVAALTLRAKAWKLGQGDEDSELT